MRSEERKNWILASLVFILIFSTLFIGNPLVSLFRDQNFQAGVFLLVMGLVGISIILHALKYSASRYQWTLLFGLAAVFVMFFLRLGLTERSHLLEYSILAIFIHRAMLERYSPKNRIYWASFLSFLITTSLGLIDECLQMIVPDRHFDPNDIIFNTMATAFAIGFYLILYKIRRAADTQK